MEELNGRIHGRIQSHQVLVWFSIFSGFFFFLSLKIKFLISVVLNALSYLQITTWVDFRKRVCSEN